MPNAPTLPVFKRAYGRVEAPSEAWAIGTLGYEGRPAPARHLAALVDEVASGVATIAATPDFAHRADGLRAARKGLTVAVPHDLLRPRDVLVASAHALSTGVELLLDIFPPGPPADAQQDAVAERWLRWQFTLRAGDFRIQPLLDAFDLFPLRFVSTPYLDEGTARPFGPATLRAAATPPQGRNATLVFSPSADWAGGDHLLLALVGSRREPYWLVAATFTEEVVARAEFIDRLDRLAGLLLDRDAHGGFLHPLGDLAWSNVAPLHTWHTAGRSVDGLRLAASSGVRRVDLESFAAHEHFVEGVSLLPAALMWLGRGFLRHVIEARAAAFTECDDNRELGPGRRRLRLGDPRQGVTPALVARQWAMRRALNLEPPAARIALPSADAVRLRLEAEQRAQASAPPARNALAPTSAHAVRVGFSMRGAANAADAAMGLRFAVKECVFDGEGLCAHHPDASETRVAWAGIATIVARQMPPDPPYERVPFLDLVPKLGAPLRILAASRVNYAALPGGAAPIAIDNLRRLGRLVVERNPSVAMDPETRAFLEGRPPQAFAGLNQFTAYDGKY